jgi:hypothetical protein
LFTLVGGILLLGLPGFALVSLFDIILTPFVRHKSDYPADTIWPIAVIYSLVFPWLCFGTMLLLEKFLPGFTGGKSVLAATLCGFTILFIVHALFFTPERLSREKDASLAVQYAQGKNTGEQERQQPSTLLLSAIDLMAPASELMATDTTQKKNVANYTARFHKAFLETVEDRDKLIINDKQGEYAEQIDKEIAALGSTPENWTAEDFEKNPTWIKIRKLSWSLATSIDPKETLFKHYINYPVNRLLARIGL